MRWTWTFEEASRYVDILSKLTVTPSTGTCSQNALGKDFKGDTMEAILLNAAFGVNDYVKKLVETNHPGFDITTNMPCACDSEKCSKAAQRGAFVWDSISDGYTTTLCWAVAHFCDSARYHRDLRTLLFQRDIMQTSWVSRDDLQRLWSRASKSRGHAMKRFKGAWQDKTHRHVAWEMYAVLYNKAERVEFNWHDTLEQAKLLLDRWKSMAAYHQKMKMSRSISYIDNAAHFCWEYIYDEQWIEVRKHVLRKKCLEEFPRWKEDAMMHRISHTTMRRRLKETIKYFYNTAMEYKAAITAGGKATKQDIPHQKQAAYYARAVARARYTLSFYLDASNIQNRSNPGRHFKLSVRREKAHIDKEKCSTMLKEDKLPDDLACECEPDEDEESCKRYQKPKQEGFGNFFPLIPANPFIETSTNIKAQEEPQSIIAQEEPQNIQAQEESQNITAQEERQNIRAQEERQNITAQEEPQNITAEEEPQNITAEEEPQNIEAQEESQNIEQQEEPQNIEPQQEPQNIESQELSYQRRMAKELFAAKEPESFPDIPGLFSTANTAPVAKEDAGRIESNLDILLRRGRNIIKRIKRDQGDSGNGQKSDDLYLTHSLNEWWEKELNDFEAREKADREKDGGNSSEP